MANQITYRALGPNNDPLWGSGQNNFLGNVDAVAQAILTRLLLFEAEWWADTQDGTPYWQSILGKSGSLKNQQAVNLILQQRILGTPFVVGLQNLQYSFNSGARSFNFYTEVQTQFGTLKVTFNQPSPPDQGIPVIGLANV